MKFVPLGLLASLGLGVGVAQAAPVAAPVVAEPLAEKDGLKVSIVPTSEKDGLGIIELKMPDPFISVELRNTSDRPINVLDKEHSWGANDVTIQITQVDGKALEKPLTVFKMPPVWVSGGGISSEEIAPGQTLLRHVRLRTPLQMLDPTSRDTAQDLNPPQSPIYWKFPVPLKEQTHRVTMRAVFSNDNPVSNLRGRRKTV